MQYQGQTQIIVPNHNCFKCCVLCFLTIFFIFGCCLVTYNLEIMIRLQKIEKALTPFSSNFNQSELEELLNEELLKESGNTWSELLSLFSGSAAKHLNRKSSN